LKDLKNLTLDGYVNGNMNEGEEFDCGMAELIFPNLETLKVTGIRIVRVAFRFQNLTRLKFSSGVCDDDFDDDWRWNVFTGGTEQYVGDFCRVPIPEVPPIDHEARDLVYSFKNLKREVLTKIIYN